MAKRRQTGRPTPHPEEMEEQLRQAGEVGGFAEEAERQGRGKQHRIPKEALHGRTIGETATSYTSVGGAEEPEEWPERIPEPDDNAPDYETPGGAQPDQPTGTGPVHDIAFRPAPGGAIETLGHQGKDIPYTGEVASTRGATFEEDPDTGKTASEEEGEFVRESLEERTRGFESG
ncbi:MAG: hypothetical protein ACM3US_07185 [Sphingomonadaceae bacterium]